MLIEAAAMQQLNDCIVTFYEEMSSKVMACVGLRVSEVRAYDLVRCGVYLHHFQLFQKIQLVREVPLVPVPKENKGG